MHFARVSKCKPFFHRMWDLQRRPWTDDVVYTVNVNDYFYTIVLVFIDRIAHEVRTTHAPPGKGRGGIRRLILITEYRDSIARVDPIGVCWEITSKRPEPRAIVLNFGVRGAIAYIIILVSSVNSGVTGHKHTKFISNVQSLQCFSHGYKKANGSPELLNQISPNLYTFSAHITRPSAFLWLEYLCFYSLAYL